MISKYSTHKTWAFVLERAFSCWYRRYRHRSQDLREDLKATSRAAFVPLEMMLLPSYLSNWRGQEGFSPCLCDAVFSAAPVPTSARPVQKEVARCSRLFQMAVLCFPFECVRVSQSTSVRVYGRGSGMGLLQCWGTWPDSVEDWLPGLFVWNLFSQAHDLYSHASGAPQRVPP